MFHVGSYSFTIFLSYCLTNITSFVKLKRIRRIGMQYTLRWLEMHMLFKSEYLDAWYDLGNLSENGKIALIF
jgi:hypothetical protein